MLFVGVLLVGGCLFLAGLRRSLVDRGFVSLLFSGLVGSPIVGVKPLVVILKRACQRVDSYSLCLVGLSSLVGQGFRSGACSTFDDCEDLVGSAK